MEIELSGLPGKKVDLVHHIAEEVISHLAGLIGVEFIVTLEIEP